MPKVLRGTSLPLLLFCTEGLEATTQVQAPAHTIQRQALLISKLTGKKLKNWQEVDLNFRFNLIANVECLCMFGLVCFAFV